MKDITNVDRITKGARLGKIATLVGLGFLVGGLIISLVLQESPLLWLSFACLLLGLLVSSVGTMNMNRWVREPRADQALVQGLKGFDNRYRLYNYVLPAPHVLLTPVGLFVLTAMGQDGVIRYEGDKFRRDFSLGRLVRFMAEEGLGRPFAEADAQVQALQKFLEEHDAGPRVEIQNVLIFYNPRAQLSVSAPPRPVVLPKGLKKAIRKQAGEKLSSGQYRQLQELFEGGAA
jgi:hypothetical protein